MQGLIGPNLTEFKKNIDAVRTIFSNHETDLYVFTYKYEGLNAVDYGIDYLIETTNCSDDELHPIIQRMTCTRNDRSKINNLKEVRSIMVLLDMIRVLDKKYDYVCRTRTDQYHQIDNIDDWFIPNTYVIPNVHCYNEFNDQFGIADMETMRHVWYYESIDEYIKLYSSAYNIENCLHIGCQQKGIPVVKKNVNQSILHPDRLHQ